jgi:hypothetical protein
MKWCDLMCKYAEWPDKLHDGAKSCRTFVALWCKKKKEIVYKNAPCIEKEEK